MKDVLTFNLQAFAGNADSSTGVVKVGDNYYLKLQDAITSETTGGTITFLKDNSENVTISEEAFTFDYSTATFTGSVTLDTGTLTIGTTGLNFSGVYELNATNNSTYALTNFDSVGNDQIKGNAAFTNNGTTFTLSSFTLTGLPTLSASSNGWGEVATSTYQTNITAGSKLESNSTTILYQAASTTNLFNLSGIAKTDGIGVSNTSVTLFADNLNEQNVTLNNLTSTVYSLQLGADATGTVTADSTDWSYSLGTATYLTATTSTSYSGSGSQITYNETTATNVITAFSGVNGTGGLGINTTTKVVTLNAGVLSETNVVFTNQNGYIFAATGIAAPESSTAGFGEISGTAANYFSSGTTAGYALNADSTTLKYTSAVEPNTLFTLSGIKATDGLVVDTAGYTVTLSESALNDATVYLSSGTTAFTLSLGAIAAPVNSDAYFTALTDNSTDYMSSSTSKGYTLNDDSTVAEFTSEVTAEKLFSISGLGSIGGLTLDASNTVTLNTSNLTNTAVALTGGTGYSLALGAGVNTATFTAEGFTFADNTATYYNAATSTGYAQVDAQNIGYYTAAGGDSVTAVYGVISASGLTLEGTVVTVGSSALSKAEVTISDGFTLALGADVSQTSVVDAKFGDVSSNTAVYYGAYNTEGYKLNDSSTAISYVAQESATELFKLTGIGSVEGLTPDASNTITVATANLVESNVTLAILDGSSTYTLALNDTVAAPVSYAEGLYSDTASTAAWQTEHNSAGYSSTSVTEIAYTSEVKATDLIGVSDIDEFKSTLIDFDSSNTALTVSSGSDVLTIKNETENDVTVAQFGTDLTMASSTSIIANETWAYQDSKLHYGSTVNLTNVSGIDANTAGDGIKLENGVLVLPTGVEVESGTGDGATFVEGVDSVRAGSVTYEVVDNYLNGSVDINSDVSVIKFDGSEITFYNSSDAKLDSVTDAQDYATASEGVLTLGSKATSDVTVENTSSDNVFVKKNTDLISLNENDTMLGDGTGFTNAASWKYQGNSTLTSANVTLTGVAGITTDTTVTTSDDSTATLQGTGISYIGATTTSTDAVIVAATSDVTVTSGAISLARDSNVALTGSATIGGVYLGALSDARATMGSGVVSVEGTALTDYKDSLYVNSGIIAVSTATDTKAVTVGDGANVSGTDSDVAISLASDATVTINSVAGLSATGTTITPVSDGVAFTPGSGTVGFGESTTFTGGKASINPDNEITLFSDASVTGSDNGEYIVNKSASSAPAYIDRKALLVDGNSDVTVTSSTNGFVVGSDTVVITNDDAYTVVAATGDIESVVGISAGATVNPNAGKIDVVTDSEGAFTIGEKTVTISGDTQVAFGVSDSVVTSISSLEGAVIGNFNDALTVDGGRIEISGENAVTVSANSDSKITEISGIGGADTVTVASAGGAPTIVADSNGTFQFGSGQAFAVEDLDGSVSFLATAADTLQTPSITGVSNLENGTIAFYQDGSIEVNGNDVTLNGGVSADSSVTLTTAAGAITSVEGLFGLVNGLTGNATVSAVDSDVTVNSATIQINEGTSTAFEVQVESGTVKAVTGINANAVVNTANNVSVVTAEQGTFTFPNGIYNLSGSDSVSFVTDANSNVVDIQGFSGTLTSNQHNITVNGAAVYTSNTDVSLISSGNGVGTVTGLQDEDVITAPDGTKVIMPATSTITVNRREYTLFDDADGIIISGSTQPTISGLDPDANLVVANGGTYVVNKNTTLQAVNGDRIIGDPEGTAHIYEGSDIYFESDTDVESIIEAITGISETDTKQTNVATDSTIGQALNEGDTSGADGNLKVTLTNPDTDTETAQSVNFSSNTGVKEATLEKGDQNLAFNNEGGNVAIVDSDSTGKKNIALGNGGDLVVVEGETKAEVNVTAGTGKDTIVTAGNAVTANLNAGGATRVMVTAGNTTLQGYRASTGAGIQVTNSNIYQSVKNNIIALGDGLVAVKSAVITTDSNASPEGSSVVNFFDLKGNKYQVGYTHSGGGEVDLSASKEGVILKGNYTSGGSNNVLRGGNGDDSILAGANDVVDAGAGVNQIDIGTDTSGVTTVRQTAETGRTTVTGFEFGFSENRDRISISDVTKASVEYNSSNGKVTFSRGNAKLIVTGSSSSADLASSGDLSADGASQQLLLGEGDNVTKLEVAEKDAVIGIADNSDNRATAYRGNNSGLNFSNVTDNVGIVLSANVQSWLNIAGSSVGVDNVDISGFNKFQGGKGNNMLVGADNTNNTIVAGTGNTSIYGGTGLGADSLVGDVSSIKSGSTSFFFINDSGKDTVSNFEFLASDKDNLTSADKVNFMGSAVVNAEISGNNVVVELGSLEDRLTIEEGRGKNIQIALGNSSYVAKVDETSLNYDGTATLFMATGKNATVSVASDVSSGKTILLGNENFGEIKSDAIFYGNIRELNASSMEGRAFLGGNANDNVIRAAQGDSTLWGGSNIESNDTLIGGNGHDFFYYGKGQGNDRIIGADGNDVVALFDISLDDISAYDVSATAISATFKQGGSITIENANTSGVNFRFADGSTYAYNSSENQWEAKQQ